jgi:site-specific DNA-methyltransferase (adenine-specific)
MRDFSDKFFNLAVVDPPYFAKGKYTRAGKFVLPSDWEMPTQEYYDELVRVSHHQIIWGINYFNFSGVPTGRIIWDKQRFADGHFSDGEIASCSMFGNVKFFRYLWDGCIKQNQRDGTPKIHPTQKPVALYSWIYNNFLKGKPKGRRVLDTHLGSFSSAVAAADYDIEFYGSEIDVKFFSAGCNRLKDYVVQGRLFA